MNALGRRYLAVAALLAPISPAAAFAPLHSGLRTSAMKMIAESSSTDTPKVDLNQAKARIASAISVGAPAYNAGNVDECAREYKSAAADIAPVLPPSLRSALETALGGKDCEGDDDAAAWAIRREFDAIVEYVQPYLPASAEDADGTTLEPFTDRQLPAQPLLVLDNVMGGVSLGLWDAGASTFRGNTSLQNNGGFASLRWRFDPVQNWSYTKGIYLKARHSNPGEHTFRLILKDTTCEMARGANFKAVFCNPGDAEEPVLVPFEAFDQMEQMGRQLQGPALNRAAITEVGLMAIKPSVVGDFDLKIEEWGLYC